MSADASAQDRHSAMLAELAAMSLTLARDLQTRALEAETPEEAAKLAAAFHRVSRGLRQTLALELKVIRYRDEAAREAGAAPPQGLPDQPAGPTAPDPAVARRLAAVRRRIRDAWSEHEAADWLPDDAEDAPKRPPRPPLSDPLWGRLDAFLDAAAQRPDLLDADFDILVIEACDAIGLDAGLLYDIRDPATPEPAPADSS
ncbi:hypothetical protein [Phenylobacterium sp.]|uniref:hypothetical protein n=1 Tax=Phenylobacterium sp. TaxID=1871053 RepID=UPI002C7C1646|nr:hypothetical protein [Phenylobacterium sp.]HVI30482.1 hypothetical protein [Phenylobacterium sp.]